MTHTAPYEGLNCEPLQYELNNYSDSRIDSFLTLTMMNGDIQLNPTDMSLVFSYSLDWLISYPMYPESRPYTQSFAIDIHPCVVLSINPSPKKLDPVSYTIGTHKKLVPFDPFAQFPACGYPMNCYLTVYETIPVHKDLEFNCKLEGS